MKFVLISVMNMEDIQIQQQEFFMVLMKEKINVPNASFSLLNPFKIQTMFALNILQEKLNQEKVSGIEINSVQSVAKFSKVEV